TLQRGRLVIEAEGACATACGRSPRPASTGPPRDRGGRGTLESDTRFCIYRLQRGRLVIEAEGRDTGTRPHRGRQASTGPPRDRGGRWNRDTYGRAVNALQRGRLVIEAEGMGGFGLEAGRLRLQRGRLVIE